MKCCVTKPNFNYYSEFYFFLVPAYPGYRIITFSLSFGIVNILLLSDQFPPEQQGGAGVIAYRLAREFSSQGHKVSVISTTEAQPDSTVKDGIHVSRIFSSYPDRFRAYYSLYNPRTVPRVRQLLQTLAPDVVYAHNIHQHLSYHSLKLAHDQGIPVFLTAHDAMSFAYGKLKVAGDQCDRLSEPQCDYRLSLWRSLRESRLRYFPLRNSFIRCYLRNNATRIISVSNTLRLALETNGIRNVETIHNGIDAAEMHIAATKVQSFISRFELQDKKIILFGGRLSYLKGAVHMLQAMKIVVQTVPKAVLVIVGENGRYAQDLQTLAGELDLTQHITFTGWIDGDTLKSAYTASDVVAVPSIYFDPFPTVNLEAMAASKPVVATCFGGSREVVLDNVTGYIINPCNIDGMAERIGALLGNYDLCHSMGEAGRRRVQELFSLDKCAQKYLSLLQNT